MINRIREFFTRPSSRNAPRNVYCSFCRRSHRDVGPFVEGPGNVYICCECIDLCQSIMVAEKARLAASAEQQPAPPAR